MRAVLDPFSVGFMQRAFLEAALLAGAGAVIGVQVLLRRRAFLTEVVQHGVFPGIALAFTTNTPLLLGAVVGAAATFALLGFITRRRHVDADSAMAFVISTSFALGVVIVSHRSGFQADLTALLFGRILAVDVAQLVTTAVAATACVALTVALSKELVLRALDPVQAAALGYPVAVLDFLLDVCIGGVVVLAARALGTVLVVAFLVTPPAAARLISHRISSLTITALAVALVSVWLGLTVSYDASVHHGARVAPGAAIVLAMTVLFLVVAAVAPLRHRNAASATA